MGNLCKEECSHSFYWHLIPSELKLEEILNANPPKFEYNRDFFIHLVHLTNEIPAKNKTLRRKDGYVPLHSRILQSKNKNYHLHLRYLVDNKILEELPHYKPGIKARMYRIAETYLKDRLIEIMVSDKHLIKQLAKQGHLDFKLQRKYEYLQKWFDSNIEVDSEAALAYCVDLIKQSSRDEAYQVHL